MNDQIIKAIFRDIAVKINPHGDFLTTFAEAVLRADEENFALIRATAIALIQKYGLELEWEKKSQGQLRDQFYNSVYKILIDHAGAPPSQLRDFVMHHADPATTEWRFCGIFGMSGKYWAERNQITGDDHDDILREVNVRLARLAANPRYAAVIRQG